VYTGEDTTKPELLVENVGGDPIIPYPIFKVVDELPADT
jgi:hypothetical protein